MNAADTESPAVLSGGRERIIITLLSCIAAVHVFIFCAAFPPINNVDESAHFDLAVKYSHGHLPGRLEPRSDEALGYIRIYASQEYFWPPVQAAPGLPGGEVESQRANHESSQPPLYYALAGFWWKMGQWFGFGGGTLFYCLRFLNIMFVAALVWLGYFAARTVFPENLFARLAVPALLAFLPQTAFYSINNDVLSPLCFGAAFVCLARWLRAETPGAWLGAITGITLAATFLAKMSNLPLLAVSAAAVLFKIIRYSKMKKLRALTSSFASLYFCAALPMAAWATWCQIHFGDFTGSGAKARYLGWTLKPAGEWWHHPIFTPHGAWTFVSRLVATFWQGEFWWHGKPLALPFVDMIYILTTLVVVAMVLAGHFSRTEEAQRQALCFALANLVAAVAFLASLSILYDFNDCFYPSREHPYFTSGRLMLGALIPFLLLFVFGLDRALSRFRNRAKFLVLVGTVLFMLNSEIVVDWPVFFSKGNWFHM